MSLYVSTWVHVCRLAFYMPRACVCDMLGRSASACSDREGFTGAQCDADCSALGEQLTGNVVAGNRTDWQAHQWSLPPVCVHACILHSTCMPRERFTKAKRCDAKNGEQLTGNLVTGSREDRESHHWTLPRIHSISKQHSAPLNEFWCYRYHVSTQVGLSF